MIERLEGESQFDFMKRLVYGKLVDKTISEPYEDLSELLFGDGNCFNESEVRKRCYGILAMIRAMDESPQNVKTRILCTSDQHVPFHLPVDIFIKYKNNTDVLIINGDLINFNGISKFAKVSNVSPLDEIIMARQYLIDLISYVNPKKIYITVGNHERRFEDYIEKNLANDLINLLPRTPFDVIVGSGFFNYDRASHSKVWYDSLSDVFPEKEFVSNGSWFCQIGDTIFAHPTAFSSGILKTAEKAMYWFRNEGFIFKNLVLAHTHRSGEYDIGNTRVYEQGTCSDVISNNYRDGALVNEQKEGFIYLCQDKDDNTIKELTQRVVLN